MRTLEWVDVVDISAVRQEAAVLAGPAAAEAALDTGGGAAEGVMAASGHGFGDRDIPRQVTLFCQDLRDAMLLY